MAASNNPDEKGEASSSAQVGTTGKYGHYVDKIYRLSDKERQKMAKEKEELEAKLKAKKERAEKEREERNVLERNASGDEGVDEESTEDGSKDEGRGENQDLKDDQEAEVSESVKVKDKVKPRRLKKRSGDVSSAGDVHTKEEMSEARRRSSGQGLDWPSAWEIAQTFTGTLTYSDGDPNHRPDIAQGGRKIIDDMDYLPTYFRNLKRLWVNEGGAEGLEIKQLPDDYSLWKFTRPNDSKHVDRKLYGHPKGKIFMSVNEFFQHYRWLVAYEATNGKVGLKDCPCQYCQAHHKKEKDKSAA